MTTKEDKEAPGDKTPEADESVKTDQEVWEEFDDTSAADPDEESAADDASEETPEDEIDPEPEPEEEAPADKKEPDEEEKTSDDSSAELEKLREQNARLEQQFRSEQSRSEGQFRSAERLRKELNELKAQIESRPEPDAKKAEERKQRIENAVEEYGDAISPLVEELEDLKGRDDRLSDIEKRRLDAIEGQLDDLHAAESGKLEAEHPEGLAFVRDNAAVFREWIDDQPKKYRDIYQRNSQMMVDGSGAALLVSRFKAAVAEANGEQHKPKKELETRRERQLKGAKTVRTSGNQAATELAPDPDSDDMEQHWDYWDRKERREASRR